MEVTAKVFIIANDYELLSDAMQEMENSIPGVLSPYIWETFRTEAGEPKADWYYFIEGSDRYSYYDIGEGGIEGNDWQGMLKRNGKLLGPNGAVIIQLTSPDRDMYEEFQWSSPLGRVNKYYISENYSIYKLSYGKFIKELRETVGKTIVEVFNNADAGKGERFNITRVLWEKECKQHWQEIFSACEKGTSLQEWVEICRRNVSAEERDAYEQTVRLIDLEAKVSFDNQLFRFVSYTDQSIDEGIQARGGALNYKLDKMTDYLVFPLDPLDPPLLIEYEKAQALIQKGNHINFVSDYQVYQALLNTPPLFINGRPQSGITPMDRIMTYKKNKIEQEKQRKANEAKRQREEKRRLLAEEKMRLAEEVRKRNEEKRRALYEAKQKEAEERQRLKEENQQEKAEQNRLAREARAQKEQARLEALENAKILYAPGEEPANIRKRMDTLFAKLDEAYPDKKIIGLHKNHGKWGETVTKLYQLLGYPDGNAFLEAYGYTVEMSAMGRKASVDPVAIMEELHRRYANGRAESMAALQADNPDIPWKTLANNAKQYFGNTLAKHLKAEEIL